MPIQNTKKYVACMTLFTFTALAPISGSTTDSSLLSTTNAGYAFVEKIQEQYCNKKPSHDCKSDFARCKERYELLWRNMFGESPPLEGLKTTCDRVSTKVEIPGIFTLLNSLYLEVREVAPQEGLPQLDNVHLGSLAIREVNARVFPPDPDLGHFLFFNIRFFEFASELAKVAALSIPIKVENDLVVIDGSQEALAKKIAENQEIQFLFINRVLHFLDIEGMKPALPPSDIQPILSRYQQGIELFAMAHEYSHIARKHTGGSIALEMDDFPAGTLEIYGTSGSWAQELEADFYAAKIIKRIATKRISGENSHVADYMLTATPEFYFLIKHIMNEARDIFFTDTKPHTQNMDEFPLLEIVTSCARKDNCSLSDTLSKQPSLPMGHPSSAFRRAFVKALLEDNHSSRSETRRAMTELATQMARNIEYLWNSISTKLRSSEAEPLIKKIRDNQVKSK